MSTIDSCRPAPYGRACVSCSRAKCKCFNRSDGPGCERCHRLGKACEPAVSVRKRRTRGPTAQPSEPPPAPASSVRIEGKLDLLVDLLKSRVHDDNDPAFENPGSLVPGHNQDESLSGRVSNAAPCGPDVVLDTDIGILYVAAPGTPSSTILADISTYSISEELAEEHLQTFRSAFLQFFPLVHLPYTMRSQEVREQKPFLWLVIQALSSKDMAWTFKIEETIWHIISRRIICEHLADIDLLLGLICFASWHINFKQDKSFIGMISQCAVAMATDLGFHKEISAAPVLPSRFKQKPTKYEQARTSRTSRSLEERRTFLALFNLTSSTWSSERKIMPMRWTPYLESCLRILEQQSEAVLDALLIAQARCHIITNQMTCWSTDDPSEPDESRSLSPGMITALQAQLSEIKRDLSPEILSLTPAQLYIASTQLKLLEASFSRPRSNDKTGQAHLRRLEALETALTCAESWLSTFFEMPYALWVGIDVEFTAQVTHCLVVLFKLSMIEETGWDVREVKARADVFEIIDRHCDLLDRVPAELGLVDAPGPRKGILFKASDIFRMFKGFMRAKVAQSRPQDEGSLASPDSGVMVRSDATSFVEEDAMVLDSNFMELLEEPWASDIFNFSWDISPDDVPLPQFGY